MGIFKFDSKQEAFTHVAHALGIDKEPRPPGRHDDLWLATHDPLVRETRAFQPFSGYVNGDGSISIWLDKGVGYRSLAARLGRPELDEAAAERLIRPKIEGAFRLRNAKFEGLI